MATKKKNEVAVVEKRLTEMERIVADLEITDQISYDRAAEYLLLAKQGQQQAIEAFDPQREAAYNAYQVALGQLNRYKNPFVLAEKHIKGKMSLYLQQQEEKRRHEEKLAREEAERIAEDKRQKLLKKAAKAKSEEKREELEEQADMVVAYAPQVSLAVSAAEGTAHRFVDKVTVVDLNELIAAIASGKVAVNVDRLLTVKVAVLDELVKLTGVKSIPGCNIERKPIISASRG